MTPIAAITLSTTSSAVVAVSSRANHAPPGAVDRRAAATATAVLPTPPGPRTSTSRCVSSSSRSTVQLEVATDELGADRRKVADRCLGCADGSSSTFATSSDSSCTRTCCSTLPQQRSRLEAELVGQPFANPLVGVQRIGLAPGAVEGRDQEHPQALLERELGDRPLRGRRSRRRGPRAAGAQRTPSR